MTKLATPIVLRAASLTLAAAGAFTVVVGTVSTDAADPTTGAVKLGSLNFVTLVAAYTRNVGGGAVGVPRFAVDISHDPDSTDPAAVANFIPLAILDTSTVTAVVAQPEIITAGVTAAGATTRGTPPWNVGIYGARWMRVRVADSDASLPGALAGLKAGGVV